jgi:hypothetical protein
MKKIETFREIQKQLRKSFSKKMCMVPDPMKSQCSKKKPNCHTISKSASLKKIAVENHVYRVFPNDKNFYEQIGINDATVFYGFCKKHDTEIFSLIENIQSSISSPRQLFLLAYRSLCLQLYKKRSSKLFVSSEIISEKIPDRINHNLGIDTSINDLEFYKKIYDSILLETACERLTSILIKTNNITPVMGTGFIFPDIDLNQNTVQDLGDHLIRPKGFSINCVGSPGNTEGIIALTATANSRELLKLYCDQLELKDDNEISEAIVKLLFLREENIVFGIDWWNNLSDTLKSVVKNMYFVHSSATRSDNDVLKEREFMSTYYGFFNNTKVLSFEFIDK